MSDNDEQVVDISVHSDDSEYEPETEPEHSDGNPDAETPSKLKVNGVKCEQDSSDKKLTWYKQKFRSGWLKDPMLRDWLQPCPEEPFSSYCNVCECRLKNCNLSGLRGHSKSSKHLTNLNIKNGNTMVKPLRKLKKSKLEKSGIKGNSSNTIVVTYNTADLFSAESVDSAERLLSDFMTQYRMPVAQAEHLVEVMKNMFPDSGIAKEFTLKHTPSYRSIQNEILWERNRAIFRMRRNLFFSMFVSKPAPAWEGTAVIDGQFRELKLSDFRGKYLVFFFYPLDFTFVCPTEILAFNDRIQEFHALNTEVVACSIDSHFTHLAWTNTPRKDGGLGKLSIPLLSDITHKISKDYGVFLEDQGIALRGLFIIDGKGVLRQITMNDLPVGRSVDETLRLVQAFQFTDEHGEVCPAGWKPGDDTIIPNPHEKLKYFHKANQ